MNIGPFPHQVTRLVFGTGQPYEEFRARVAAGVPFSTGLVDKGVRNAGPGCGQGWG
jgi:hypothetical protein